MNKLHYYGIDWLRGVAAIGIVGRHLVLEPKTPLAEFMVHYCDLNVAIFGAISGFFLAMGLSCSDQGVATLVVKKCRRILPTYLIWTAIYIFATMVFDLLFDGGSLGSKFYSTSWWLSAFLSGNSSCHLWFVIDLFYISICVIVADRLLAKFLKPIIWLAVAMALLYLACSINSTFGYYPIRLASFVVLGYYICIRKRYAFEENLQFMSTMVVMALFLHLLLKGVIPAFVRDAVCVYVIINLFTLPVFSEQSFSTLLSRFSYGLYLMHPLIAVPISVMVRKIYTAPYGVSPTLFVWLVTLIVSYTCVWLLYKNKRTRWTVL